MGRDEALYPVGTWKWKPYVYHGKLTLAMEEKSQNGERPAILRQKKHNYPKTRAPVRWRKRPDANLR